MLRNSTQGTQHIANSYGRILEKQTQMWHRIKRHETVLIFIAQVNINIYEITNPWKCHSHSRHQIYFPHVKHSFVICKLTRKEIICFQEIIFILSDNLLVQYQISNFTVQYAKLLKSAIFVFVTETRHGPRITP